MILASQSPRRIELMREADYDIRIILPISTKRRLMARPRLRSLNA